MVSVGLMSTVAAAVITPSGGAAAGAVKVTMSGFDVLGSSTLDIPPNVNSAGSGGVTPFTVKAPVPLLLIVALSLAEPPTRTSHDSEDGATSIHGCEVLASRPETTQVNCRAAVASLFQMPSCHA